MKKQILSFKNLLFLNLVVVFFFLWSVYAVNIVAENISPQTASGTGSSGSSVSFITWGSVDPAYINVWNNSTIIWNYFRGYYYDSVYWFFQLDWDSSWNIENNVHISGSTDKCGSGYGYKIWWYAYSENFWLIDFDHDSSTYVYYCLSDKQMYGYAYSELVWFQNFEGIWFEIITEATWVDSDPSTNSWFTNSTTTVDSPNQNYKPNKIGTDIFQLKDTDESIFYIIK